MQAAARTGNAAAFFDSARTALQPLLATRWQIEPEDVTTAEVATRVGTQNDLHQLFALADESKYSGREPSAIDFARWLRVVPLLLSNGKST
jgi:hypothetical protein